MIAHAFKLDRFEPERIVTSNWVRPKTLAAIRVIETLYVLIVIIAVWISSDTAVDYLKYFTNLTYFGLAVYLLVSYLLLLLFLSTFILISNLLPMYYGQVPFGILRFEPPIFLLVPCS